MGPCHPLEVSHPFAIGPTWGRVWRVKARWLGILAKSSLVVVWERAYGVGFALSMTDCHWVKLMSSLHLYLHSWISPSVEWEIARLVSSESWEMLCILVVCNVSFITEFHYMYLIHWECVNNTFVVVLLHVFLVIFFARCVMCDDVYLHDKWLTKSLATFH